MEFFNKFKNGLDTDIAVEDAVVARSSVDIAVVAFVENTSSLCLDRWQLLSKIVRAGSINDLYKLAINDTAASVHDLYQIPCFLR